MASFYDSASIITIPSGYKAGTLYSQIPTDGAGDMTFTRTGDTATRVNSAGIIERCITNFALQSETFENASWVKTLVSVTSNAANNPLTGTATADKLIPNTTNGSHFISLTTTTAGNYYNFSVYAKADGYNYMYLRHGVTNGIVYNLSDGTMGTFPSGYIGKMTSVGNGWYRCEISGIGGGNQDIRIHIVDSSGTTIIFAGDNTNGILIYGAQFQTGDLATNYIPTTTATVTQGPVTNLPRLDYFGSTCPQLLMEPTRTNLEIYSQMFDASAWIKNTSSVSGNVAVSPDGYQNADALIEDTTSGLHSIARDIAWVSGTTYTFSCFVKQGSGTRRFGIVTHGSAFGSTYVCNFNLQTGVVTSNSGLLVGKIENYGNGWYRCIATATATASSSRSLTFCLRQSDVATSSSYTGDGTSSLFIWGAQVEAGAYATSYIPTTAATVTRNQDICLKTGISSLIGATEGTLFVDINYDSARSNNPAYIQIFNSSTERQGIFYSASANIIRPYLTTSGSLDFALGITPTNNTRYKLAYAYKANDFAFYVNGQAINIGTRTSVPTAATTLHLGCLDNATQPDRQGSDINQALVFKTRLSNADLATLTTL